VEFGHATRKYLGRWAEPEVGLADAIPGAFADVLVIPCYGEGAEVAVTLASVPASPDGGVLIIVVLNARRDSPQWVHDENARTRDLLADGCATGSPLSPGTPLLPHPRGGLLLVDRAGDERFLPERQGVGLARKIGADIALALVARGAVRSPWIHCTDADARLPADYFEQIDSARLGDAAALVHPFRHPADPATAAGRAVLEYEASLRYHVLGLRYAGSRYAHHSIGSAISIHSRAYAEVRGFPRRRAAEDFYLLNKLAKVGEIVRVRGAAIELSGRASERVPFGTGRAVRDALACPGGGSLSLYDPAVFAALRAWIRTLDACAQGNAEREPRTWLAQFADAEETAFDTSALESCLDEMNAFGAVRQASTQRRSAGDLRRHLHDHFDAFRCLKLAHALRDRAHPSLPLRDALARAPFIDIDPTAPLPRLCEQLATHEQRPPAGTQPEADEQAKRAARRSRA